MSEKKKKPKIQTLEDKGTKLDFVDLGNGRQVFIYREEKFRGIQVAGFRLGWSEKYKVVSPQELTSGTIDVLSDQVTRVSGSSTIPDDFEVMEAHPEIQDLSFGEGYYADIERVRKNLEKLQEEEKKRKSRVLEKLEKKKKKFPKQTKYV